MSSGPKQYTFPDVPFEDVSDDQSAELCSPKGIPIIVPQIQTLQHCPQNENNEG
eukprot:CAMPEP_0182477016 /NCGR_PEP_ID=MMETSP1319-20130603/30200_1 /TAXON_ID=172717 /ORGANISM="Bolidomonas pacifica, Strain RCC208" /LENGTH=53 /DNA_ID=CAMNT_0024678177 /DNA_START=209 /DNA_END=367 /DNA_ORIENTATION=+